MLISDESRPEDKKEESMMKTDRTAEIAPKMSFGNGEAKSRVIRALEI